MDHRGIDEDRLWREVANLTTAVSEDQPGEESAGSGDSGVIIADDLDGELTPEAKERIQQWWIDSPFGQFKVIKNLGFTWQEKGVEGPTGIYERRIKPVSKPGLYSVDDLVDEDDIWREVK